MQMACVHREDAEACVSPALICVWTETGPILHRVDARSLSAPSSVNCFILCWLGKSRSSSTVIIRKRTVVAGLRQNSKVQRCGVFQVLLELLDLRQSHYSLQEVVIKGHLQEVSRPHLKYNSILFMEAVSDVPPPPPPGPRPTRNTRW